MATTAKDILAQIKEKDVKYVDVHFTDIRGKMQHVTFDIDLVDDDFLTDGTMFDGSSISGWKAINESDMKLRPDLDSAIIDPFYQQTTMAIFCDVVNPDTGTPLRARPAFDRQGGIEFREGLRDRRHGLLWPRSRVLHLRRRALVGSAEQHRLFL